MARKSDYEKDIENVATALAWWNFHQFQNSKKVPLKDKVQAGIPIISKTVAQKVNLGGQKDNPVGVGIKLVFPDKTTVDLGNNP
jgi:hypothetical protein